VPGGSASTVQLGQNCFVIPHNPGVIAEIGTMYINIHTADELTDSPGKNTKAWNDGHVTFRQVRLQSGNPGIEIRFACTERFGTGERNSDSQSMRSICRKVSIALSPEDVSLLASALIKWPGPAVDAETALDLIQKLAGDMRNSNQKVGEKDGAMIYKQE